MTTLDRSLCHEFSTEDTTSVGGRVGATASRAPAWADWRSSAGHSRLTPLEHCILFIAAYFRNGASKGPNRLGTAEERDATLQQFRVIATDVTSWEVPAGTTPGLIGVVAPGRQRRELFRSTIDITPGRLPRRRARFAFLDSRESLDGDD